jgi:putative endonuclease
MQRFYVYIMTNRRRTLYVGITNDLTRRVLEHKCKTRRGFARKYDITMLAWFEEFYTAEQAILAEKKIKGWLRSKKVALIESINPDWQDLAASVQSEAPVILSAPAVILSAPAVILSAPAVILSAPAVILSAAKNLAAPIEIPDPSLHSG